MKPIRVILVDDHLLVRDGFCTLLEGIEGVEVVGSASDGRQSMEIIREDQPDVVLMDITMPELNGLEATFQIKRDYPGVNVIILSMHAAEEYVIQALDAGASGYLLKDAKPIELELAVRAAAAGHFYLSPQVSRSVIENYRRRLHDTSPEAADDSVYQVLTPRQREVIQLIAEGKSSAEIADALSLSIKTVGAHRRQIMQRLNVSNLAGLVRYAVHSGIVKDT